MKGSAGRRAIIAIGIAGAVTLLGLAGCARPGRSAASGVDSQAETTDLGWEQQALQSIGYSTAELAPAPAAVLGASAPAASTGPSTADPAGRRRHRLARFAFGRSALHGEAVVQTDDGTKTVVVQRGVVTAVDGSSITVKSADGFTLTWTYGSPLTVIERRAVVAPSAIVVGAEVGVAGAKSGSAPTARLIVIPTRKS